MQLATSGGMLSVLLSVGLLVVCWSPAVTFASRKMTLCTRTSMRMDPRRLLKRGVTEWKRSEGK